MKYILSIVLLITFLSCNSKMTGSTSAPMTMNKELRVLCYNIHHANPPSQKELIDVDTIARVIINSRADIIALQEMDKNTGRSGNIDEAKLIAEKTGMQYHFFKAIDHDGGDYGLAILSRFPLHNVQLVPLPQMVKAEDRILAIAEITIDGKKIIFANTHLDANRTPENRNIQMQEILKTFANEKLPVLLCGDLNSMAGSDAINMLDKEFMRTCITGCPGTVPQGMPTRTIDFIATKNVNWPLLSYEVIPEIYASDHRPVLAVFKLK